MKISCCWLYAISKYGYPPSIDDTFKAIKEMAHLGFKYIELEGVKEANLREVSKNRNRFKKLCDDSGLKVVNFCPVLPDIVSLDKKRRQNALKLFKLGIELALYFGCSTIQTDSYIPPLKFSGDTPYKDAISFGRQFRIIIDKEFRWKKLWGILVDSISFCAEESRKAGLKFCLEPRVGELISNTDAILRLMDAVDNDNFGAVLDTGHQHAQKEILPLSVEKLSNRIFYLHISDNDGLTNQHLAPGRGTIDWDGIFAALKKHKFRGFAAVDVGNVPDIENQYREAKEFLEKMAAKHAI